jgi:hypothetical protein
MRPYIEQSNGPVSLSPFQSWPDCIITTSGYDFRKGQAREGLQEFRDRVDVAEIAIWLSAVLDDGQVFKLNTMLRNAPSDMTLDALADALDGDLRNVGRDRERPANKIVKHCKNGKPCARKIKSLAAVGHNVRFWPKADMTFCAAHVCF